MSSPFSTAFKSFLAAGIRRLPWLSPLVAHDSCCAWTRHGKEKAILFCFYIIHRRLKCTRNTCTHSTFALINWSRLILFNYRIMWWTQTVNRYANTPRLSLTSSQPDTNLKHKLDLQTTTGTGSILLSYARTHTADCLQRNFTYLFYPFF